MGLRANRSLNLEAGEGGDQPLLIYLVSSRIADDGKLRAVCRPATAPIYDFPRPTAFLATQIRI